MSQNQNKKKLYLTKEETQEVQARRDTIVYLHNLILGDIQNYLSVVVLPRLAVPEKARVRVSDDATYLEIVEDDKQTE